MTNIHTGNKIKLRLSIWKQMHLSILNPHLSILNPHLTNQILYVP